MIDMLRINNGSHTTLSATTSSARTAIPELSSCDAILVRFDADTHVRLGDSSVAATTTDRLIVANETWQLPVRTGVDTHIAYIVASGTASGWVESGQGGTKRH